MSLVYLVTRLPKLTLGEPAPISREAFIRDARASLEGSDLVELERVALCEEIDETVRTLNRLHAAKPNASAGELAAGVRTERKRTGLDRDARDLPDWVLDPAPQHVLLRRYWERLSRESQSEFVRAYASFYVNVEEVLTGLRCQREQLPKADFLEQMSGHFDSSARVIVQHYEQQNLGVGDRFSWLPRLVAALNDPDRVAGERAIDQLRWLAIDNLKGISTFSIDIVLATYFQLRLVDREAAWNKEQGLARLDEILIIPALEDAIGATA